jgi:hypothetical protein
MPLSIQPTRSSLYAQVVLLAMLILLMPVNGITASQKDDPHEHPPKLLNYSKMTTQQLVAEGEKVIFGGIGQSKVRGAIGKAQCPLCHAIRKGQFRDTAPNLIEVTKRAADRLRDPRYHLGEPNKRPTVQHEAFPGSGTATTTLEYLAESDVCHSCFVMAGWGVRGSNDTDTGAPSSIEPPISLSIDELVAMTTWFYVRDGKKPPLPQEIENAYKKFVDPSKWKILVQTRNFPKHDGQPRGQVVATGHEAVSDIFDFAQCHLCHTIPGVQGAIGNLGPPLGLKTTVVARLKDPSYRGKATTPWEYVYESIIDPSAHVVQPFPDNAMPKDYGSKLSALAVDKMTTHILSFESEPESSSTR